MKEKSMLTLVLSIVAVYFFYKTRYRLLNRVLRNSVIRSYVVRFFMDIPSVRSRFISSAFRQ